MVFQKGKKNPRWSGGRKKRYGLTVSMETYNKMLRVLRPDDGSWDKMIARLCEHDEYY